MSHRLCLVLTGTQAGGLIFDPRVGARDVVLSGVGFNPGAPTLGLSVVDFREYLTPENGGLRSEKDSTDYRMVIWLEKNDELDGLGQEALA